MRKKESKNESENESKIKIKIEINDRNKELMINDKNK